MISDLRSTAPAGAASFLPRRPHPVEEPTLAEVWPGQPYGPNVVEVHISALRRKLEANGHRMIFTVRGAGYVLRP